MICYDEATETLPCEQLAPLRLRKMQIMMAELWNRTMFYTSKWKAAGVQPSDIKSLGDLVPLPLTKKDE